MTLNQARAQARLMAAHKSQVAVFLTDLDAKLKDGSDSIWVICSPLIYYSPIAGIIEVPVGFETDFASVPRVPIVYALYGNRAHREGVVHDYLFRKGSIPRVSFMTANKVFLEAMDCRGKAFYVRYPMYSAVCAFSYPCYHKRNVEDKL